MDNTSNLEENFSIRNECLLLNFSDYVPWNNPYDKVSYETYSYFQIAISGAYLPILFLISTPTNILNMVVFYKHGLTERINLGVFCRSLSDCIFLTEVFLQYSDTIYMKLLTGSRYSGILGIFLRNKVMGIFGFWWVSAFITTIISCERCACVVSPLRSHLLLKTKTTAAIIVSATIIIVGLFFVVAARWTTACVYDPVAKSYILTMFASDFYLANAHLVDTLEGVVYGVILPVFCVMVVTTTTAITAVKLKQMKSWREQTSSAANLSVRDITLTRMLIGMSIMFVVCNIPGICFRSAMLAIPDLSLDGRYRNSLHLLFFFHQFFAYTNSSFNFFIYYNYGTKFRETVKTILFHCFSRVKGKKVSTENLPKSSFVCCLSGQALSKQNTSRKAVRKSY